MNHRFQITLFVLIGALAGLSTTGCAVLWQKSKAQQAKIEEFKLWAEQANTSNKELQRSNHDLKLQLQNVDNRTKELKVVADTALDRQAKAESKLSSILRSLSGVEQNLQNIRIHNTPVPEPDTPARP